MSGAGSGALTGTRAGPWLLLDPIAEGGMGAVYRARRDDGAYEQYAAIKLIRAELLGFDAELREEMLRRFHEERRILAQLDHPGIARIIDGGTTASAVPYLAMELVHGKPILDYARDRNLGVGARVRLFIGLCEAVQAAHRGLVVHRDIKPANVLVDSDGQVKLVDFGIAKVLEGGRGEEAALHTRTGWAAMTPDYASPEQIQGQPVTTASDVYALGVVLYELLTGERPYSLAGATPAEIERVVCGTEPQAPSRVGRNRGVVVPQRRQLRGDLDQIVLKAMRKEAVARYASASDMAADLRRHLEGLPVAARGDAWAYRTRKFLRRNALTIAATLALFAVLLGSALVALDQARSAREQAARATLEAARASQVTAFLQRMIMEADPYEVGGEISMADAMRAAALRIGSEFPEEPAIEATLRRSIGRAFMGRGMLDEAEPHLRRAFSLKQQVYGSNDPRTLLSGGDLAWLAHERGDSDRALERYTDLLARLARGLDPAREHTLINDYAVVLNSRGRYAEAEPLLRRLVEAVERGQGGISAGLAYGNLAYALHGLERLDQAADHYRKALAVLEPGDLAQASFVANNFAVLLEEQGDAQGAFEQVAAAVAMRREALGDDHPGLVMPLLNLATSARALSQDTVGLAHAREATSIAEARLPEDHPLRLLARLMLGRMLLDDQGDLAPLEALLDDLERLPSRRAQMEVPILGWLAESAAAGGEIARARALAAEGVRRGLAFLGEDHPTLDAARSLVATIESETQ